MVGRLPDQRQKEMFRPLLQEMIDPKHELAMLAMIGSTTTAL
jgi:hypothetical protein